MTNEPQFTQEELDGLLERAVQEDNEPELLIIPTTHGRVVYFELQEAEDE